MELKDYQSRVLADLSSFLDTLEVTPDLGAAFKQHWADKGVRVGHASNGASSADAMAPYKNTVPGVPHVCAKVPTAGGKTYIAVNALDTIFAALSRSKGFRINGFLNHYPDFLVKTKAGRLVVLETKGDDRDNSDSELKLKLGKLWEAKAGAGFRYMMLFDNNPVSGAERLSDALRKLAQL